VANLEHQTPPLTTPSFSLAKDNKENHRENKKKSRESAVSDVSEFGLKLVVSTDIGRKKKSV